MGGSRRLTSWSLGASGLITQTVAASAVFGAGAQALTDGLTIVRTRGTCLLRLQVSDGVASGMDAAFGMCVVSENAASVGITAVPNPITDVAWDGWMVYWTGALKGSSLSSQGASTHRIDIDSKAMRKIKESDVLLGVLETQNEVGSVTFAADLMTRVLLKLS